MKTNHTQWELNQRPPKTFFELGHFCHFYPETAPHDLGHYAIFVIFLHELGHFCHFSAKISKVPKTKTDVVGLEPATS